jgi:hypothetical protein
MPQLRLLERVTRCQALLRACDAFMRGGVAVEGERGKDREIGKWGFRGRARPHVCHGRSTRFPGQNLAGSPQ